MLCYLLVLQRAVVALHRRNQLDYRPVAEQQVRDELDRCHPQLPALVVDAVEKPSQFVRVEAFVDGLLVREVLSDEPACCVAYSVRLFIKEMNF